MLALHGAAQGIASVQLLIAIIVVLSVIFWRIMLQILIIVTVAFILIGAVTILHGILHLIP